MANNNDKKVLNVPALRFPKFTEEWKRIRVSDLLDFYSTNSLSWEQLEYESNEPYNLHYGLIHVGLPTLVDLTKDVLPSIKEGNVPKQYELCKEGDVAFADASEDTNEVAKVVEFYNLDGKKVVCGLHTIHGRNNNEQTAKGFLGYCFSSTVFHNQIRRIAQGTKIYSISTRNFSEVFVGFPSKSEQQKIATLLKLIDDRISTQNKIIEKLETLIKGIVELAFSHAATSNTLGCYITQVSQRNKNGKNLPVLSVSNKHGFVEQSEQFEDRIIASDDTSNYKIVGINDFAFNPARINVGSIARLKDKECGIVSPMYICFRTSKDILPEYLELFFKTVTFSSEVGKRLEGSVRLCLSYESLCEIVIPIISISEQQSLVKMATAFYTKLDVEKGFLRNYQSQKQYLLSQMFI